MTFLPTQQLNENNELKVFARSRKYLEFVDEQNSGNTIKAQARVKFDYDVLTISNIQPFNSIREAEQFVLEEGELFWGMSTPPLNHIEPNAQLAHRIANARANIYSKATRQGGIVVVYHPSVEDRIIEAQMARRAIELPEGIELPSGVTLGTPYFDDEKFIPHDDAPTDSVLVMYKGQDETDQGLIYVEGHGLALNDKITMPENYGKFVRIP